MRKKHKLLYNLKKYKLRSVYSQLIIMVAAITMICTAVSVIILCYLRSNMIKRTKQMQEVNMEYTIEQLDVVVRNSYQAIYAIIGSNDVVGGLLNYDRSIETYTDYKEIKDVISRLYMVEHSDLNVKNLFIIQEKYNFIIDQDGITNKDVYFKNSSEKDAEFWKKMEDEQHRFTLRISDDGSSMYVLHSMYAKGIRFATLCMELDLNNLYARKTFHEFLENRIVCVTDAEENIIGYLSEKRNDALVYDTICKNKAKGYLLLCGSTSGNELNVVTLLPMKMVTGEISILFVACLTVFAVAMFFGISTAIYIAGRIYQPLYHAVELIEIAGNRSGNDEFEIIEHNVDAILKHNQDITAVVTRSTPIVLESMFRRLIMDVDCSRNMEEMLDMLPIEVRDGYYLVVVIFDYPKIPDIEESINGIFGKNIVSLFKRHKDEYVLILYLQEESLREQALDRCMELQNGMDTVIAAGKAYKNIYSIGKSYRDAIRILDERRADSRKIQIFDADVDCKYIGYEISGNAESVLYNYVISGNVALVRETINQSLTKNLERGISFKGYQQLIGIYEEYFRRICGNIDASTKESLGLNCFQESSYSMESVEKRVELMLENYCRVTDFYNKSTHTETMEQIMEYIENNLERDIGLDDVAVAVNLTSNYITKYFKSKSGINFKTCLTMKRMERAKELLIETDMAIKDIAERCGYNSSKQLIVNFTKDTGVSPTEYRKCRKKEQ